MERKALFTIVGLLCMCIYLMIYRKNLRSMVGRSPGRYLRIPGFRPAPSWPPRVKHLRDEDCATKVARTWWFSNKTLHGEESAGPLYNQTVKPMCDAQIYRQLVREEGYFPKHGFWKLKENGFENDAYFTMRCDPNMEYISPQPGHSPLLTNILSRQMKHIMVLGDSHAFRVMESILTMFQAHSIHCALVKRERHGDFKIKTEYFNTEYLNSSSLTGTDRRCMTCKSQLYKCLSGDYIFQLEQVALNYIIDTTLTVKSEFSATYPAGSSQELMFRHYFRNNMPDVVIIHTPFTHEVHLGRNLYDKVYLDLKYLTSMMDLFLPSDTKIVWIPTPRIYPNLHTYEEKFPEREGLSTNEQINMLNIALFEVLKEKLKTDDSNTLATFDSVDLTCHFNRKYHMDNGGVHYLPFYYDSTVRLIFQLLE